MSFVLEVDVHNPSAVDSPVKARLEKEAVDHPKRDPSELQRKLEEDLEHHAKNREKILENKVHKAHDEVEHAKRVSIEHKKAFLRSVQTLHDVLDAKQQWAQDVRVQCLSFKSNRGHDEVLKATAISDDIKLARELAVAQLAGSLERGQELASRNRAALEQFKRVQAELDVEHSQEVHDKVKEQAEVTRSVMDVTLQEQQKAAALLRFFVLREKAMKAHTDVENAKIVHDKHEEEERSAVEELELEIEQKDINAFSNRRQRLNEIRLRAHDEVLHAQEVAIDHKEALESGEDEDLLDLEKHLKELHVTIDEQRVSLDEWFKEHMEEMFDEEFIPDELNEKIVQ